MVDGEPDGLRIVELSGWIGKLIIIPRNKLKEVKNRPDCNKPSVYFLVGKEDEETPAAYIGETEVLWRRLDGHDGTKDFWMTAVAFFSHADTLTKAHVKYLESRCIKIAGRAGRFKLKNSESSSLPSLPEALTAEVEAFLSNMRLLLTAAGYPILQEVVSKGQTSASDPLLICRGKGAKAEGRMTNDGFVVYKGSTATTRLAPAYRERLQRRLDKLIDGGYLKEKGEGLYVFARDCVFNSPTGAVVAVLGNFVSGRKQWKTEDGRTCGDVYRSGPDGAENEKKSGRARQPRPSGKKASGKILDSRPGASGPLLICRGKGAKAEGRMTNDGFVVYKGSTAATRLAPATQEKLQRRLDKLIGGGYLEEKSKDLYVFVRDCVFNSPTGAGAAVLGHPSNGWIDWKTEDGRTCGEVYRSSLDGSEDEKKSRRAQQPRPRSKKTSEEIRNSRPGASGPLLICHGKGAKAEGRMTNDGFIVYKGSTATTRLAPARREKLQRRLDKLIDDGYLKKRSEDLYVFVRDCVFSRPGGAGTAVLGHPSNGWIDWKTEDGRTCKDVYRSSKGIRDSRPGTSGPLLICRGKGAEAKGRNAGGRFVVYKGSTATTQLATATRERLQKRLDKLIGGGYLKEKSEGLYVFVRDCIFNSPSGASDVVLGRPSSGKKQWKTEDGVPYETIYRQD